MNVLMSAFFLAQAAAGAPAPGTPAAPAPAIEAAPAASAAAPVAAAAAPASAPVAVPAEAPQQGGGWQMLIFFGLMIAVFYFLIILPQQRQRKKADAFLSSLKQGDKVVTASGMIGRIASLSGNVAEIELAKDVRIKMVKAQIVSLFKDENEAKS